MRMFVGGVDRDNECNRVVHAGMLRGRGPFRQHVPKAMALGALSEYVPNRTPTLHMWFLVQLRSVVVCPCFHTCER